MGKDNKGLAEIIVGTMSKGKPDEDKIKEAEAEDSSDDEMSEDEVAASEVMDALKDNDVSAFTEALKSFIKICSYDKE